MTRNSLLTFLILTFLSVNAFGQKYYKPKKVKAEGNYTQEATNTVFPAFIDNYGRTEITAFDKKKTNLGVTYENKNNGGKTTLTIYIYPAGSGTEDRISNEYLKSLQSIANVSDKGIHAVQNYCFFQKDAYKVNGYKAYVLNENNTKSVLAIYECGNWFFKIRVTSDLLDSLAIDSVDKKVLELFSPTNLVKISCLNPKANIYFAKNAFRDSILLGSAMGSALKKIEWAMENVDSLERASGFPGLYLNLHIEAWKEFVNFEKTHNEKKTSYTNDYLEQINSLIDIGFLDEFIMEQYDMIMIVPDEAKFDFEAFDNWKTSHPISINLNERFYVIEFGDKKK